MMMLMMMKFSYYNILGFHVRQVSHKEKKKIAYHSIKLRNWDIVEG